MGHIAHIATIAGVFYCVHHFWPKGITYGEREEWEKKYRHHHIHGTSSSSSRRSSPRRAQGWYDDSRESSSSSSPYSSSRRESEKGARRRDKEKSDYEGSNRSVRERDIEYGTHPVYSRHASFSRGHDREGHDEYDEPPAYSSRRGSARY